MLVKYSKMFVKIICHNKGQPSKTHLLYSERHWYYRILCNWWCHHMEMFPLYWPSVRGIHRSPMASPHKGQWRGTLKFALICAWTNGWANNLDTGDLRCHRAHYDVTVMRTPNDWTTELAVTDKRDLSRFDLVWDEIQNISLCCLNYK